VYLKFVNLVCASKIARIEFGWRSNNENADIPNCLKDL